MGRAHPTILASQEAEDDHESMPAPTPSVTTLGGTGLPVTNIGLGLAALGRPAYIDLEPSVGSTLARASAAGWGVMVKEALANGRLVTQPGDRLSSYGRVGSESMSSAFDHVVDGKAEVSRCAQRHSSIGPRRAWAGEGAMEVYVEPVLPATDVRIVGSSPMTQVLSRLAEALGWRVQLLDDPVFEDVTEASMIVVGTQGHYDEPAVEAALATPARYVGLVASEKRAASVRAWLQERGMVDEAATRLRTPAGLDLGPVEHEEIAVAILAELVALKASGGFKEAVMVEEPETAIDPVCEMTVDVAAARFKTEYEGVTYYFCAAGCQRAFEVNPSAFTP